LGYPFNPDFTVGILYRVKIIRSRSSLDLTKFFHFGIPHARLMADSMTLLLTPCRVSRRVVPSCIQRTCWCPSVSGFGISFFLSSFNPLYYFSSYQVTPLLPSRDFTVLHTKPKWTLWLQAPLCGFPFFKLFIQSCGNPGNPWSKYFLVCSCKVAKQAVTLR
jgi:hypothetical protein